MSVGHCLHGFLCQSALLACFLTVCWCTSFSWPVRAPKLPPTNQHSCCVHICLYACLSRFECVWLWVIDRAWKLPAFIFTPYICVGAGAHLTVLPFLSTSHPLNFLFTCENASLRATILWLASRLPPNASTCMLQGLSPAPLLIHSHHSVTFSLCVRVYVSCVHACCYQAHDRPSFITGVGCAFWSCFVTH